MDNAPENKTVKFLDEFRVRGCPGCMPIIDRRST